MTHALNGSPLRDFNPSNDIIRGGLPEHRQGLIEQADSLLTYSLDGPQLDGSRSLLDETIINFIEHRQVLIESDFEQVSEITNIPSPNLSPNLLNLSPENATESVNENLGEGYIVLPHTRGSRLHPNLPRPTYVPNRPRSIGSINFF